MSKTELWIDYIDKVDSYVLLLVWFALFVWMIKS